MKGRCVSCGAEYEVASFEVDPGICKSCKPGFFGLPAWRARPPAATRALFLLTMQVHTVLFLLIIVFIGLIVTETEGIVLPGCLYCIAVFVYIAIRYIIGLWKGFPALTPFQALALQLLPLYGLPFTLIIAYLVRALR